MEITRLSAPLNLILYNFSYLSDVKYGAEVTERGTMYFHAVSGKTFLSNAFKHSVFAFNLQPSHVKYLQVPADGN